MVDWSGGVLFANCISRVQLSTNACNWMATVCAAALLALANQLPLLRLVRSLRKQRYIRIRPLKGAVTIMSPVVDEEMMMPARHWLVIALSFLQCFDTVGWVTGNVSSL